MPKTLRLNKNTIRGFSLAVVLALILPFLVQPAMVRSATQDELKRELEEIERQIAEQEAQLTSIKGEKHTIEHVLNQLRAEQNSLRLKIRATNLQVQQLDGQIGETEERIAETNERINTTKQQLASAIRELHQKEQQPLAVVIFSHDNFSEALNEYGALQNLSSELADLSNEMFNLKLSLEQHQQQLEDQQEQTRNLLSIQYLQESEYQAKVEAQTDILSLAAAQEAEYETILNQTRQRANEIRARLYELAGGSTTNVTFGEAVEIARQASAATGVRAALLLAVITQESNLGKNVGTCNRPGDPPEKSWRQIMHPTRDQPKFLEITKELGLDPDTTPLSCPMRDRRTGRQIGWGGAMGPAQFIPSTWMAYRDRVSALIGRPANPWNIYDAFVAAAVLLKANGATEDGENGEWRAAMRYFSGSTNPRFRFYGDNVLALARRYQAEIDALYS